MMLACAGRDAKRPSVAFAGVNGALVIAHRGGSGEAPENTLAAIRHAVQVGADWQELDVTLTRDDHVVVIHDDTLDRTTSGTGEVAAKTLHEIRALSAGNPKWTEGDLLRLSKLSVTPREFGTTYESEKVPTLAEVLELSGTRLMIEMKRVPRDRVERLAWKVIDAIASAGAHERVLLASFDPELLWAAHQREPSLPLIGIAADMQSVNAMLKLPVVAVAVGMELIEEVKKTVPAKVAVWAWTAYTPEMAEAAIMQGVNGVITDVPEATLRVLRPNDDLYVRP